MSSALSAAEPLLVYSTVRPPGSACGYMMMRSFAGVASVSTRPSPAATRSSPCGEIPARMDPSACQPMPVTTAVPLGSVAIVSAVPPRIDIRFSVCPNR